MSGIVRNFRLQLYVSHANKAPWIDIQCLRERRPWRDNDGWTEIWISLSPSDQGASLVSHKCYLTRNFIISRVRRLPWQPSDLMAKVKDLRGILPYTKKHMIWHVTNHTIFHVEIMFLEHFTWSHFHVSVDVITRRFTCYHIHFT